MAFMKRCFSCGEKVEKLHEGLCEVCNKEQNPPIKEIKPANMKYCNECCRVHYNNIMRTMEEIEEMLPNIMKSRVILNPGYKLNSLDIHNFKRKGNKLSFDVEVDCDLI